jgi:hypothetical protein
MIFWIRELVGWVLLGLGLLIFFYVYALCTLPGSERRPIDAGILLVMGVFVFRGGIHLLKVAVAAQAAREAREAARARPESRGARGL